MTSLDVSLEYPMLVTDRMTTIDSTGNWESPVAGPYNGGLAVDVGLYSYGQNTLVVTGVARGWGADWDASPGFAARIWEGELDFGMRWSPSRPEERVQGWWAVGTGLRASFIQVEHWGAVLTPNLGAFTGGGFAFGRGKVRPTASIRADLNPNFETWTGTLVGPEGTTTWTIWPGSARVSALVGAAVW